MNNHKDNSSFEFCFQACTSIVCHACMYSQLWIQFWDLFTVPITTREENPASNADIHPYEKSISKITAHVPWKMPNYSASLSISHSTAWFPVATSHASPARKQRCTQLPATIKRQIKSIFFNIFLSWGGWGGSGPCTGLQKSLGCCISRLPQKHFFAE